MPDGSVPDRPVRVELSGRDGGGKREQEAAEGWGSLDLGQSACGTAAPLAGRLSAWGPYGAVFHSRLRESRFGSSYR